MLGELFAYAFGRSRQQAEDFRDVELTMETVRLMRNHLAHIYNTAELDRDYIRRLVIVADTVLDAHRR